MRRMVVLAMLIPVVADARIDPNSIRRVVDRHRHEFRQCYERALVADPKLAGIVHAKFEILPSGRVGTASADGLPGVDACVADVIRTLVFPKPPKAGGVMVNYPFEFRPS